MQPLTLLAAGSAGKTPHLPFDALDHWYVWVGVLAIIIAALLADLIFLHRDAHAISMKEAAWTSLGWIVLSVVFGLGLWAITHNMVVSGHVAEQFGLAPDSTYGSAPTVAWFGGYLLEKALSVDNIFVIALLFAFFKVPAKYQHRVLFWGVFGALVMRALFIALGAVLIAKFEVMLLIFGLVLLVSGAKMAMGGGEEEEVHENAVVKFVRKVIPVTKGYEGTHFFVRKSDPKGVHKSILMATPMFVALIAIETTDVIFAVDSIPAVFGVTDDPFIVFTSNAFAILGLRALYFLLGAMMDKFRYLKVGLSAILIFIGLKMSATYLIHQKWFPYHDPNFHISVGISLGVIVSILVLAVGSSLWVSRNDPPVDNPATDVDEGGGVEFVHPDPLVESAPEEGSATDVSSSEDLEKLGDRHGRSLDDLPPSDPR